jgi:hypothetical protein
MGGPDRREPAVGLFDKAKDLEEKAKQQMAEHPEQTEKYSDEGIEKAGDAVDRLTGGKYADQVDKGQRAADEHIGE